MPKGRMHGFDLPFLLLFLGIAFFGILVLISASGPEAYANCAGDSYCYIRHQIFFGWLPGIGALILAWVFPMNFWKRLAPFLLVGTIVLLILVFIPGIGEDYGTSAKSWIDFFGLSFQPSELAKLTFLLYVASWLSSRREHVADFREGLLPFLGLLSVVGALIFFQPDLGTLSIIVAMSTVMYFVGGGRPLYLAILGAGGIGLFALAIKFSPYRLERFTTFLHPEFDPQGIGYQINQALLAVGSGGFFGRGYGHSLQKYQYLPEVIGDSIFAVLAEEFGFFLTTGFLLAFVAFLWRGFLIAERTTDDFSRYCCIGILSWFGIQAFVNIGAIVGILPLTGVPLPFVSYGGTSLVVSLFAVGMILNISSHTSYASK
ncbi:MAG: putative lipid II flippase FtsW [Patescibacteria group bacterium]|jgi:cell division protein FtsW